MTDRRLILYTIGVTVLIVWLVVSFSAMLVLAIDVFLLAFLGVMFAVFLTKLSGQLSGKTGMGYGSSLAVITLCLMASVTGIFWFFGNRIEQQIQEASGHVDEATEELRDWVRDRPLVKTAISDLPFARQLLGDESLAIESVDEPPRNRERSGKTHSNSSDQSQKKPAKSNESESNDEAGSSENVLSDSRISKAMQVIAAVFQTVFGAMMNIAIVLFVGMFIAIDPSLYRDGITLLFPKDRRDRVRDVLNQMGSAMWHWLIGRFASMLITGLGTGIGLAFLGVPMPIALGTLTGLLAFIPNFGPALALGVALLVALPQGGTTVLLVVIVFSVFQILESYVITPLVQQQQVSIPPALLITWQVLLGMLIGFLGVTVSTPLLAILFVLVRTVYIEDVLEDRSIEAS